MTLKKTYAFLGILLALFVTAFLLFSKVEANPLAYATTVQTAAATTSPAYLTPGVATSTLVYDSYAARPTGADKIALQVQAIGSSTASVYNISYEYTNGAPGLDCVGSPTSCDWYKDNTFVVSTSSAANQAVATPNSFSWTFASSTQGGAAATDNRALKTFIVPTVVRYTRVIFSITGANGSVWAQIVPAKQNN